ncbi:hypothetical protein [Alteribacter aurantiacus]|uniref:hypothetical protein n=1 Tax=Alteribacter aurantiacus TaxID=254410 RepID=UPI0004273190|nr:hypothetical protein [Alteribacter aurantiacus]
MDNGIGKLAFGAGWTILVIGAIASVYIGLRLMLVPAEVGVTGYVFDEGIKHPLRWFIAGGLFTFTTVGGLILVAISGVIQEIEYRNEIRSNSA